MASCGKADAGETTSAEGAKPMPVQALCGLEMDLQLIDWLNRRAYHVDLQWG